MPINIVDGIIQISNGLPIKIGTAAGLLPGYEHLYFQNTAKKYPFAWAESIPWIHFVDNQQTGSLDLYSDIPLNSTQWNTDVLNFSSLFKNHDMFYQHVDFDRIQLGWKWAYKVFDNGTVYNPYGSHNENLNFVERRLLSDIALKLFSVLGHRTVVTESQRTIFINNLTTPFDRRLLKDNVSMDWSSNVIANTVREQFYLGTLGYLNYCNSLPGSGTIDFVYWPIQSFNLQSLAITNGQRNISNFPSTMRYSINVSLKNLIDFISSRGENTKNLDNIPTDRKHKISGVSDTAPPPSMLPDTAPPPSMLPDTAPPPSILPDTAPPPSILPDTAPPPSMLPATSGDDPTIPTIPETIPIDQPGDLPGTTDDAATNGGENLTDYNQPGQIIPLTSTVDEPPVSPIATDGNIPLTDLNTWIDSRIPDDQSQLPITDVNDTRRVATDTREGAILPLQALQTLPLPEGYTVDDQGHLTKKTTVTKTEIFYPIGSPQWGKHFDVPLRALKIDPQKYCAIGLQCYGTQFEPEPPLWWFQIHAGSTR